MRHNDTVLNEWQTFFFNSNDKMKLLQFICHSFDDLFPTCNSFPIDMNKKRPTIHGTSRFLYSSSEFELKKAIRKNTKSQQMSFLWPSNLFAFSSLVDRFVLSYLLKIRSVFHFISTFFQFSRLRFDHDQLSDLSTSDRFTSSSCKYLRTFTLSKWYRWISTKTTKCWTKIRWWNEKSFFMEWISTFVS